ncbi:hydantoinase/oxoprolinase family protein [Agrobacterium sp. 22-221-1]|uniref:hydantoinase/oxoprolinase family protein n=1 Tax=Agrobacterium leguminum TaxID=2792015 RepID=UPI003CE5A45E
MNWIIGVDVGGTFTDFFAFNAGSGESRYWKRPSTPDDPARAIIRGLDELSRAHGIDLTTVSRLCHGSTVATNALIQRRGAPVGLVTTKGFRDVLEIGRQTRPAIFDLHLDQPAPLVPRRHRFEIDERIMSDGTIHKPVDRESLADVIEKIRRENLPAIAVCLLFSYLNPDHERQIGAAISAALPDVAVSLSSEVQPEFREFERFTTTVVNAYLQPRLDAYITTLIDTLGKAVPNARVGINQSSGGLMSLTTARAFPVRMALSGPAAGIVGAIEIAKEAGYPHVITLDIGGTSADVALIRDNAADLSNGRDVDGFPIRLPMIDIATVGAGGGSIAWFDTDGLFKVGPQSAGAVPGPACYQRGGTLPTVSDANLILGRLPATLIDGEMTLDRGLAVQALRTVADPMGKTVEATALGVLEIMTGNMVRAIRTMSVERGHDPRRFALMPFGGAGALHARDVAVALGIGEIIVPLAPGIVCAQGLTDAKLQESFVVSNPVLCDDGASEPVALIVGELVSACGAWFEREQIAHCDRSIDLTVDARFRGQNYELNITLGQTRCAGALEISQMAEIKQRFLVAHERAYGFADRQGVVEIVNFRAVAHAPLGVARPPRKAITSERRPKAAQSRDVCFAIGRTISTPAFHRADLEPGDIIDGPAVIDQMDATTVIFPGDVAHVDTFSNIIIKVGQDV